MEYCKGNPGWELHNCVNCERFQIPDVTITASDVKELRECTGADMVPCQQALKLANNDMDKAVEFLRVGGYAVLIRCSRMIPKERSHG